MPQSTQVQGLCRHIYRLSTLSRSVDPNWHPAFSFLLPSFRRPYCPSRTPAQKHDRTNQQSRLEDNVRLQVLRIQLFAFGPGCATGMRGMAFVLFSHGCVSCISSPHPVEPSKIRYDIPHLCSSFPPWNIIRDRSFATDTGGSYEKTRQPSFPYPTLLPP